MKRIFLTLTLLLSSLSFGKTPLILRGIVHFQSMNLLNTDNFKIIDEHFNFNAIPDGYANTVWVITTNRDLNGNTVLLPEDVTLSFQGGKFSNGTLEGLNTKISANLDYIFNYDLKLSGTWNVEGVNPIWFGAIGNGVIDDSNSLERALNFGGKVDLLKKTYLVSRQLTNVADIDLQNGTINSTAPKNSAIILNSSANINVYDVVSSGDVAFIRQTTDFNNITINKSKFTGASNSIFNYMLTIKKDLSGNNINLSNNETYQATLLFADDVFANVCNVEYNYVFQPTRFAVRSLEQGSGKYFKIMNFNNNRVYDINGELDDKSKVARCLQIQTSQITNANNNLFDGAESVSASNFIYNRGGSLIARNNVIKNIKGHHRRSIIDDKSHIKTDDYFWVIEDNTFDFRDISISESPEAMIRINESRNVSVSNNTFKGLKCFAVRVYHSMDTGNYPENITIINNNVYDSEFPVAFQIFQNIKDVVIKDNYVNEITNPTAFKVSGRSEVRIVDIYQAFSNGFNLDGVSIKGNILKTSLSTAFILTLYRNIVAVNSDIVNVSVISNEMKSSSSGAFVRVTGVGASGFDLINNVGVSGVAEIIGVEPAGTRKVNNVVY